MILIIIKIINIKYFEYNIYIKFKILIYKTKLNSIFIFIIKKIKKMKKIKKIRIYIII